jgi:DNA polymerase V
MTQQCFALVDVNNFYASCERVFRPDLTGRAIVVASNNDGCAVARSAEAKALGIKMGEPLFKIQPLIRQHNVVVCSSNYTLYADMSQRVMTILDQFAPAIEIYSIDEAFLDLTELMANYDLESYGACIRTAVQQQTGLIVCVGIAPTKTLAKLANYGAKKYKATGGVVNLMDKARQRKLLAIAPVEEVWGVGRRIAARLQALGITTALQLADANPKYLRQHFSVVLERTAQELNGTPCMELEDVPATKKQIICSRSFGRRISDIQTLSQALAEFTTKAAEKIRKEGLVAKVISVFIHTSAFATDKPQHSKSLSERLVTPTADTRQLLNVAQRLLTGCYRPGYDYAKAGVMLTDFYDPDTTQADFFAPAQNLSPGLMAAVDKINQSGTGKVFFASVGTGEQRWGMRRDNLSPCYTTKWDDIILVR